MLRSLCLAWARLWPVQPSSLGTRPRVPGVPDQPSAAPLCWELLTIGSRQLQGWHSCFF